MTTEEAGTASGPPSPPLSLLRSVFLSLLSLQESNLDTPTRAIAIFDPGTRNLSIFHGALPDLDPLFEAKSGPPPASRASIDALPRALISEDDNEGSSDCAVCLEEYAAGDEAREMPCRHRFHSGCIERWLSMHGTCPVCRFAMPLEEDAKVPSEGGENRVAGQRPVTVMFLINGQEASTRGSGHGSTGHERSPGSDDGVSVDSSVAQDMDGCDREDDIDRCYRDS